MRKIVGSIIAVCFIQIGFHLYTVIEQTSYSFTSVSADVPASPSHVSIADVQDAFQESVSVENRDPARPGPYHAASRRHRTEPSLMTASTSPKPLFPTVVINIPPQERYEFTAYKTQPTLPPAKIESPAARPLSSKINSPKKGSRLVKVVKTPYDFLKFVASKLH